MTSAGDFVELARRARSAAAALATVPTEQKNDVLLDLADRIDASKVSIRAANEDDLTAARAAGLGDAKLRRLALSDAGIAQMSAGLRQVAALPDPVGAITKAYTVPSGLYVQKVRAPLGVVMMIYEARPNVTIDAFALCFKSGNACILKGGREALHANECLTALAHAALEDDGISRNALALITTSDREAIKTLLGLDQYIDLVIPRGGTELIRFVHEHSRIPMVQHFQGVCHIFVDDTIEPGRRIARPPWRVPDDAERSAPQHADIDVAQALDICVTAKTSAPAACNSVETILVHERIAKSFVPRLVERYHAAGVEVRGDSAVCQLAPQAVAASDDDFGREFLDLIVAMKVVPHVTAAIEHIRQHSSNHTESILTGERLHAEKFLNELQSSCVIVNASTRFNDGFQLGLGAEIGISTSKIHAYGPMGLEELTTQRYIVRGAGQTR